MKESVKDAKALMSGLRLNYRYCEKCGVHEDDRQENIYSCDCVKGNKYDLDRALSEIEGFFSENVFSKNGATWLDYPNGKNNPS